MRSQTMIKRNFDKCSRWHIINRDKSKCIFCDSGDPDMPMPVTSKQKELKGILPYLSDGLGVPENGAMACRYHTIQYKKGTDGTKERMRICFREYLTSFYPFWDEDLLRG